MLIQSLLAASSLLAGMSSSGALAAPIQLHDLAAREDGAKIVNPWKQCLVTFGNCYDAARESFQSPYQCYMTKEACEAAINRDEYPEPEDYMDVS